MIEPSDDIKVEIIFPEKYLADNVKTMKKFAAAAAHYCKAAALLGENMTIFTLSGISVLQTYSLEEALKVYGVEMTHDLYRADDKTCACFYADVRGLKEKLEGGN
jgi:hypothetical protein